MFVEGLSVECTFFILLDPERLRHGRHGPRRPCERGGSLLIFFKHQATELSAFS